MEILGRPFVLGLTLTLTVEAVKPLTSARGYKADRAPHDKKLRILARIQNFRHDSLIMKIICGFQYDHLRFPVRTLYDRRAALCIEQKRRLSSFRVQQSLGTAKRAPEKRSFSLALQGALP